MKKNQGLKLRNRTAWFSELNPFVITFFNQKLLFVGVRMSKNISSKGSEIESGIFKDSLNLATQKQDLWANISCHYLISYVTI